MEIPPELNNLYRHWNIHINYVPTQSISSFDNSTELYKISTFITERMRIWEKKYNNEDRPYTEDPILRDYRFCNIYRELDKQTIQIHNLLNPLLDKFDEWLLNLAFNRFLCKPETFEKLGFLNFDKKNNDEVFQRFMNFPSPKYGSAYVFPISVIQRSEWYTRELFFTQYLPLIIPKVSERLLHLKNVGVVEALKEILPIFGFNFTFHWTEILIDVAYQFPEIINLYKQFPVGPGSLPTIKMLSDEDPEMTAMSLSKIHLEDFPYLQFNGKNVWLSVENWEGIGCEYRKYVNLKNGGGRKRIYRS